MAESKAFDMHEKENVFPSFSLSYFFYPFFLCFLQRKRFVECDAARRMKIAEWEQLKEIIEIDKKGSLAF